MIVRARAPLRLGIAGGGTDVSPFCDLHGGFVLNATIDKYAYTTIETRDDGVVRFVSSDQGVECEYSADGPIAFDGQLDLHKGVYNRIIKDFNNGKPLGLTLTTYSEAPAGSGLGSSSTLVVSMIKAFEELLNLPLGEYEAAHLAYEIERIDVRLEGGKQDQYAATFGGFNFMEFYDAGRVIVNPLRIKNWIVSELESNLVLYFTGRSRASAAIIEEQIANVQQKSEKSIAAMHELKKDAVAMKEALLKGDFSAFARAMQAGWEAKKRIARSVTNAMIDTAFQMAVEAGAKAGKVSGAGGGGFIMFLVDPIHRKNVTDVLERLGGEVMSCHFTKHGTQAWRL